MSTPFLVNSMIDTMERYSFEPMADHLKRVEMKFGYEKSALLANKSRALSIAVAEKRSIRR